MHKTGEAKLLRIFIGGNDRYHGKPLHEGIVNIARKMHLAGTTVLEGRAGFGASSLLHTSRLLRLSEDLPIIIEIVDREENLHPFTEKLDELFDEAGCGGLVTIETVKIMKYTSGNKTKKRD